MKTRYSLHQLSGSVYPETEFGREIVNKRRLEIAKWQAKDLFVRGGVHAKRVFVSFATRKYFCKPSQVTFEDGAALKRIKEASVGEIDPAFPNVLGQTDGTMIEVMPVSMSHSEIVATLLHEGMHDWCRVRGKFMSCKNEHRCMSTAGDPNE